MAKSVQHFAIKKSHIGIWMSLKSTFQGGKKYEHYSKH